MLTPWRLHVLPVANIHIIGIETLSIQKRLVSARTSIPLLLSLKAFFIAIEQSSRPVSSALLQPQHMGTGVWEMGEHRDDQRSCMRLKSAGQACTQTCDTRIPGFFTL